MEFTLEFFANERYRMLKLLCDNQIQVKEEFFVPLSQQQIADLAHWSKLKSNRILGELMELGYVTNFDGSKGKYGITEKGHKVLRLIQKNNA
ncbi:MAG: hypothetical protein E7191_04725 [Erysipelotrichaceae bacterium]|nr:hypothetical protein [Erysipelotrichaceae bacterium]